RNEHYLLISSVKPLLTAVRVTPVKSFLMKTNSLLFHIRILIFLFVCTSSTEMFAQSTDTIPAQQIPEVIVTATRSEKDVSSVGREVTVISAADIQKSGARDLAQLLSNYA